jgi:hypothetical protein
VLYHPISPLPTSNGKKILEDFIQYRSL